jgi:serine/threonine protein kinase
VRRKFDQFVISRQLGEGGMSRVFDAVDETLGRHVALKILNRHYSKSAERIAQFEKEAQLTAAVTHPHVVKLFSVGRDQGNFYIAMELVSGGSLDARIQKQNKVDEREVLRVGRSVAEGLRSAYREGLIHRDVKPANILFTGENNPKIVDFGLALFHEHDVDQTGEIWATPFYVAPEKVLHNKEDFRSDIYSLGASLYHALTGKPPHKADTNSIQELKVIKSKTVKLEDCGFRFSQRTCDLINKMLALNPDNRFQNYDDLVEAFKDAESMVAYSEMSQKARRQLLFYGGAALLGLLILLMAVLRPTTPKKLKAVQTAEHITDDDSSKTLQAGSRSISDQFIDARQMLLEGKFSQAKNKFDDIIAMPAAKKDTVAKARFNAALCAMVLGNRERALQYFTAIHADPGEGAGGQGDVEFFSKIGDRMGTDLGLNVRPKGPGEDYATDTDEALGYLAQGLAQWYFGDKPDLAIDWLKKFLDCKPAKGAELINSYKDLLKPHMRDATVFNTVMAEPAVATTPEEKQKQLAKTKKAIGELKTQGTVRKALLARAGSLQEQIGQMRRESQKKEAERLKELRARETAQWTDIVATLPAMAHGYDWSQGVSLLKSIHFDVPEVQTAVSNKLYLWSKEEEFMQTLMDDVKRSPYTGHLQRRQGSSLDGTLSKLSYTDATVQLERGELVVPAESFSPDFFITMAQKYCEGVSDSTDYYRRQELIVVFAKMQGLDDMANAVASQLMEENRGFRHRWMKVAQAGM